MTRALKSVRILIKKTFLVSLRKSEWYRLIETVRCRCGLMVMDTGFSLLVDAGSNPVSGTEFYVLTIERTHVKQKRTLEGLAHPLYGSIV